ERLATRFQKEAAVNIGMRLDKYLALPTTPAQRRDEIAGLLGSHAISDEGRVFLIDRTGTLIAPSTYEGDPVVRDAITALAAHTGPEFPVDAAEFRFDH